MESRTMKKEEKKKNFGRAFCMVAIYIIIITVLCVAFQHYLYSPMRVIGGFDESCPLIRGYPASQ